MTSGRYQGKKPKRSFSKPGSKKQTCMVYAFFCKFVLFLNSDFFLVAVRIMCIPRGGDATAWAMKCKGRVTQGSVQIELIFRLLLKITVDWPFHANYECL